MICTFCGYDKLPYTLEACFKCYELVGTEKVPILDTGKEFDLKMYKRKLEQEQRQEQVAQLTNVLLNRKIVRSKCDTDVYLKIKSLVF